MTETARSRREGPKYPTPAKLKSIVVSLKSAAEAAGIKVDGIECCPDGTIRTLSESRRAANTNGNAYDDWKAGEV